MHSEDIKPGLEMLSRDRQDIRNGVYISDGRGRTDLPDPEIEALERRLMACGTCLTGWEEC
jgi:hypothetical protein